MCSLVTIYIYYVIQVDIKYFKAVSFEIKITTSNQKDVYRLLEIDSLLRENKYV